MSFRRVRFLTGIALACLIGMSMTGCGKSASSPAASAPKHPSGEQLDDQQAQQQTPASAGNSGSRSASSSQSGGD
ncbi:MAG TPA: hypothetical protein VFA07_18320 [Chthonomonadaceae bacterium]|nr:hypothetical protein [Chthonomonadaceae bacterium]